MTNEPDETAGARETVVLKFGGEIAGEPELLRAIAHEIRECVRAGVRLVVVHGGGKQATELSARLGLSTQIVAGRRVTDAATLEVLKMAFAGTLNVDILAMLGAAGVRAAGISGVDAGLVRAVRRPPREIVDPATGAAMSVDFGFVGDVVTVDPALLTTLLDGGFVPVVAPLAADDAGVVFNVNADDIASALARGLGVRRLVVASNIPGVLDAEGRVINELDVSGARALIRDGVVTGGMLVKLEAALGAIAAGVESIQVIDGTSPGTVARTVISNACGGTTIVADRHRTTG